VKRTTPRLHQPVAAVTRRPLDADTDLIRAATVNVRRGYIFSGVELDKARTKHGRGDVTAGTQCPAVLYQCGGIQALSL
jgi:hypothetical protein